MKTTLRACATLAVACAAMAFSASAFALHQPDHKSDDARKMRLLGESPNGTGAINSDIAFWGNKAFVGNYDGFRIFDISGPTPVQITDFRCFGPQNDLTVYDRNGDGEADLLIASVDRTLSGPNCGALPVENDDPTGWEGLRIFDITNLQAPVMIASVYQDCGSHTHTLLPQPERGRLLILNSSYPLRPGPTCGPVRGPAAGRDPLHGVIQVVEVPLGNPEAAYELAELPINYPGDPDNLFDPAEHGAPGFNTLRACHDIAVFKPLGLVAGACIEQAQMWRINPVTGLPDTANPVWVYQDKVDTDGPGGKDVAVDFWHSATFSWDGKTVIFIDESFGTGCPTQTVLNGVLSDTGRMFFLDAASGEKLSHYFIQRAAPATDPVHYCSSHLGNTVPAYSRDLLVNAWYTGGVDVIDFTNPRKPREIAFWDDIGDNWSGYWYEFGKGFTTGPMRAYGTHGVELPALGRGFQTFEIDVGIRRKLVRGLNPQTQEFIMK
ncbi:MAG TPA: hypothetical protein VEC06_06250 [Paucimonas sp.]|nr:hypothetical protein [Paucimonas sp.]